MAARTLQLLLPPSLGILKAATLSLRLGAWLRQMLEAGTEVRTRVATTYSELATELLEGRADLCWAPPTLCETVERAGGEVLGQFVRGGQRTFRAAFVGYGDDWEKRHGFPHFEGIKVGWVARESTAGYLLPRAWLRQQGLDLRVAFQEELFTNSYHGSVSALLSRRVDLITTFASPAGGGNDGLEHVPPALRSALTVLGYTTAVPNDGLVATAAVPVDVRARLRERLSSVADSSGVLDVFSAEAFVPVERGAYAGVSDAR